MENKNINKTPRNNKDKSPPNGGAAVKDKKAPALVRCCLHSSHPWESTK